MKNTTQFNEILVENRRRRAALDTGRYDPLKGVGCWGDRVAVGGKRVPRKLLDEEPLFAMLPPEQQERLRIVEDFEFWCTRCVSIRDKRSGQCVPFILNRPQRRLLAVMEGQRTAGEPVRVILLKARQWGGSTLVQMYLAWMQLVRHKGWNSLICGHKHAASKSIKRMYNLLLRHYPKELLDEDTALRFSKLEGQPNVQQIEDRDCLVITGSALSEDAVRGYDIAMAHLSEVAYWKESAMHNPDDVVRSVCGSVTLKADTVVVMESTANGVGDYFHDEWLRALAGHSDKAPVFVPWHEIDGYSHPLRDDGEARELWDSMDEYEYTLWQDGCTLEQINWYHAKRREYRTHELMMAEFPTTASEAFATSGNHVFAREELDRLEKGCPLAPMAVGELQGDSTDGPRAKDNVNFYPSGNGLLKLWEMPVPRVRYMTVVDVGGRAETSDYSVAAVWRLATDGVSKPAIVAQWRGHIDHDRLAVKAMQISQFYNKALLVVESNTLTNEAARAGESEYILGKLRQWYGNLYQRGRDKLGFHTNVKTKQEAVSELIAAVRLSSYIERDIEAVNEMRVYEEHGGTYAARPGKHDDILMTRAIGLYLMRTLFSRNTPPDPAMAHDNGIHTPSDPGS